MGDQSKIDYLRVLYLVLSVVGLIWFSKSLAGSTYVFLNRGLLEESLISTKQKLNKVAVELDYRKADLRRMGTGGNDEKRNRTEQRIAELEQKVDRLTKKRDFEQIKARTIPADWKQFFGIQFKDLVGWLLSLFSIYISIVKMRDDKRSEQKSRRNENVVETSSGNSSAETPV